MAHLRLLAITDDRTHPAITHARNVGHTIIPVSADNAALEALRSQQFHAVLVEHGRGFAEQTVKLIRERKPHLPLICLNPETKLPETKLNETKLNEAQSHTSEAIPTSRLDMPSSTRANEPESSPTPPKTLTDDLSSWGGDFAQQLRLLERLADSCTHNIRISTHTAAERKLGHTLRSTNSRLTRLLQCTQRMLELEQEDRILAELLRSVAAFTNRAPAVVLIRRKFGLAARMGLGIAATRLKNTILPCDTRQWHKSRTFERFNDIDLDLAAANLLQTEEYFQMPLGMGVRRFGSLIIAAEPAQVDRAAIRTLLRTAGAVLTMRRRERELRTLAERDSLTGLLNRASLLRTARIELKRHQRSGQPVSLVMLDLDHFKAVNDTHGHLMGDKILRHVARLLREGTRESDTVARYGGEEFALVLSNTDRAGAEIKVRQILESARGLCLKKTGTLTLSAGIAAYPEDGETPDELLEAADLALYEAKRQGRDCLITYHQWLENSMTAGHEIDDADGHDSTTRP